MNFILPDGSVEYAHDAAARRMRTRMTALYREPGIQALSYGLVEVGYLRIMGHDLHAADAARRLAGLLESQWRRGTCDQPRPEPAA